MNFDTRDFLRIIKLFIVSLILYVTACNAGTLQKIILTTPAKHNHHLSFWLRVPTHYKKFDNAHCRIMVLFGGRNWNGNKTIRSYGFDKLADRYGLFLLSPSFKDDEYWYPEKWSGKALLQAIEKINTKYQLSPENKLLYYGYSAGGQCANLFLFWKPEMVKAWGVHGCGVWSEVKNGGGKITAPGVVTCGEGDDARMILSRNFIYNAREHGVEIIWRSFAGGHELQPGVLRLARSFFADILGGKRKVEYVGDDQAMEFFPAASSRGKNIEIEYRNSFFSLTTASLWRKLK